MVFQRLAGKRRSARLQLLESFPAPLRRSHLCRAGAPTWQIVELLNPIWHYLLLSRWMKEFFSSSIEREKK